MLNTVRSITAVASILAFSISPTSAAPSPAPAVPMVNLAVGKVAVFDEDQKSDRYSIEYRFRPIGKWNLIPAIGYARASNDASFIHAELGRDFWLNDRWVVTPKFGIGIFDNREDLNLGNSLEFRSGIELAYRFRNNYRLGLALFHLSNAGLSDSNPGTEALVLSLSIPITSE